MPSPVSPTVAGWELALRLRQRRIEIGIEVRTITQELGFSRNYWSAIENERKKLSVENLDKLFPLLRFDQPEQERLRELLAATRKQGWWTHYSGVLDDELQRLFGLEHGAYQVRGWESLLIPGLLQTAEYATALMTPDVNLRQVEVDQRVEARMRRQERLTGDNPLRLTALISEAALRQQIGGRDILRGQLEHLADVIEQQSETVEVRVLPFTAPSYGLFGAATVHLLDFESPRLPTVIWQETVTSWGVIDDSTAVRDIEGTYDKALERALSDQDSLTVIQDQIRELG